MCTCEWRGPVLVGIIHDCYLILRQDLVLNLQLASFELASLAILLQEILFLPPECWDCR